MNESFAFLERQIQLRQKAADAAKTDEYRAEIIIAKNALIFALNEYKSFHEKNQNDEFVTTLDQIEAEIRAIAPIDGGDFSAGLSFGKGYSVGIIHRFKAKFKK